VERVAGILEISHLLDRKPGQLSGGQRQRVALARAIVREPAVFLMDEPLSNLDAKLRVSTRAQIKNLHHELRTTTIYVTHDQIEAMTLADRVVVMNRGVIQQLGSPREIYDSPANTFVAGFIGSPAMNLVQGEISGGTFRAENIAVSGLAKAVTGKVVLGFRAEDAQITSRKAQIEARVYSMELLGEASMISLKAGGSLVAIKAGKDYVVEIGDTVRASVPASICHLFDHSTGERIRPTK
jgi:multiple sugar transport system ATP-binding protein